MSIFTGGRDVVVATHSRRVHSNVQIRGSFNDESDTVKLRLAATLTYLEKTDGVQEYL